MRIRVWAFLAWLIVVFGSIIMARVVVVLTGVGGEPDTTSALTTILPVITANRAKWTDPGWQQTFQTQLTDLKISAVLWDNTAHVIFRSNPDLPGTTNPVQKVLLYDNGQPAATIGLYATFVWQPYAITYATVQIITLLGVGLGIGLSVLRPLSSMSRAARQIANNDLDFDLPPSGVREVSEVAEAFNEMRDAICSALTQQAELEQERRFFISAIAHDLRAPLFALRGYLEGLQRGLATTPEKADHYIAVCQEKADALESLVADLFAYTRLEYLEQVPQREPIDFSQLVHQAVAGIHMQAEAKQITIELIGTACMVEGDRALLGRVLDNLLDNALRYTPEHGIIQIYWAPVAKMMQFTIHDSGPGVAAKDIPHLFEPLYRGEPSRNRETGGAGLGLTIARRILRAHGGGLSVESSDKPGAAFTGSFLIAPVSEVEPNRVNRVDQGYRMADRTKAFENP